MEGKINKGKQVLVDKLDLPKEVVLNVPRITVIGKNEITIENHKGILTFDKEEIKINTNIAPIVIKGSGFEILYIASTTLIISGSFTSIEYAR